jgi:hypothetical protein
MAQTAAQRQAAYWARRPHAGNDGSGERRLSVWIDTRACLALARLACRYAVTQRALVGDEIVPSRSLRGLRSGLQNDRVTLSSECTNREQSRADAQ